VRLIAIALAACLACASHAQESNPWKRLTPEQRAEAQEGLDVYRCQFVVLVAKMAMAARQKGVEKPATRQFLIETIKIEGTWVELTDDILESAYEFPVMASKENQEIAVELFGRPHSDRFCKK